MRILLVEDEPRIARKVKAVLEEAGYAPFLQNGEAIHFGQPQIQDGAVVILRLTLEPRVLAIRQRGPARSERSLTVNRRLFCRNWKCV